MEVGADFRDAFADGGLGDAVTTPDSGHRLTLQFSVAEGQIEAVHGQPGTGLGAHVTHEAPGELEELGGVVVGGTSRLFVESVIIKFGGQLSGVFVQRHRPQIR